MSSTKRKPTAKDWAITIVFFAIVAVVIAALVGGTKSEATDPMVAKFQTAWTAMSEEDQTAVCDGWHQYPVQFAEVVSAQSGADIRTVRQSLASVCGAA